MNDGGWDGMIRAGRSGQDENFCYLHTVNGRTVPSYSRTDPFAKGGVEAKRTVGRGSYVPTQKDVDRMIHLAAQVREAYGEAAVGVLPALLATQEHT